MDKINWGIIGCGNVTEVKSGPAFNKVENSALIAVMRRNGEKAADYARRHSVPKFYDNAQDLINDPDVNAVYIATPPLYHEEYAISALKAGKSVYVEKPVAMDAKSALNIQRAADVSGVKLTVAHYRRGLQLFKEIKAIIGSGILGNIRFIDLKMLQPPQTNMIAKSEENWRVNPAISGGGLFHDLAPHQLDLMLYYFGEINSAKGFSLNQAGLYEADDLVSGQLCFRSGAVFQGLWCFTVAEEQKTDLCEIIGSKGKIGFSVFGDHYYQLKIGDKEEFVEFEKPEHIQQPMIIEVVDYLLGKGPNPCSANEAVKVMEMMDEFTGKG